MEQNKNNKNNELNNDPKPAEMYWGNSDHEEFKNVIDEWSKSYNEEWDDNISALHHSDPIADQVGEGYYYNPPPNLWGTNLISIPGNLDNECPGTSGPCSSCAKYPCPEENTLVNTRVLEFELHDWECRTKTSNGSPSVSYKDNIRIMKQVNHGDVVTPIEIPDSGFDPYREDYLAISDLQSSVFKAAYCYKVADGKSFRGYVKNAHFTLRTDEAHIGPSTVLAISVGCVTSPTSMLSAQAAFVDRHANRVYWEIPGEILPETTLTSPDISCLINAIMASKQGQLIDGFNIIIEPVTISTVRTFHSGYYGNPGDMHPSSTLTMEIQRIPGIKCSGESPISVDEGVKPFGLKLSGQSNNYIRQITNCSEELYDSYNGQKESYLTNENLAYTTSRIDVYSNTNPSLKIDELGFGLKNIEGSDKMCDLMVHFKIPDDVEQNRITKIQLVLHHKEEPSDVEFDFKLCTVRTFNKSNIYETGDVSINWMMPNEGGAPWISDDLRCIVDEYRDRFYTNDEISFLIRPSSNQSFINIYSHDDGDLEKTPKLLISYKEEFGAELSGFAEYSLGYDTGSGFGIKAGGQSIVYTREVSNCAENVYDALEDQQINIPVLSFNHTFSTKRLDETDRLWPLQRIDKLGFGLDEPTDEEVCDMVLTFPIPEDFPKRLTKMILQVKSSPRPEDPTPDTTNLDCEIQTYSNYVEQGTIGDVSVNWNFNSWSGNQFYTSPDIRCVYQEQTERFELSDPYFGTDDRLFTVVIRPKQKLNLREIYSYDEENPGFIDDAPKLIVHYNILTGLNLSGESDVKINFVTLGGIVCGNYNGGNDVASVDVIYNLDSDYQSSGVSLSSVEEYGVIYTEEIGFGVSLIGGEAPYQHLLIIAVGLLENGLGSGITTSGTKELYIEYNPSVDSYGAFLPYEQNIDDFIKLHYNGTHDSSIETAILINGSFSDQHIMSENDENDLGEFGGVTFPYPKTTNSEDEDIYDHAVVYNIEVDSYGLTIGSTEPENEVYNVEYHEAHNPIPTGLSVFGNAIDNHIMVDGGLDDDGLFNIPGLKANSPSDILFMYNFENTCNAIISGHGGLIFDEEIGGGALIEGSHFTRRYNIDISGGVYLRGDAASTFQHIWSEVDSCGSDMKCGFMNRDQYCAGMEKVRGHRSKFHEADTREFNVKTLYMEAGHPPYGGVAYLPPITQCRQKLILKKDQPERKVINLNKSAPVAL